VKNKAWKICIFEKKLCINLGQNYWFFHKNNLRRLQGGSKALALSRSTSFFHEVKNKKCVNLWSDYSANQKSENSLYSPISIYIYSYRERDRERDSQDIHWLSLCLSLSHSLTHSLTHWHTHTHSLTHTYNSSKPSWNRGGRTGSDSCKPSWNRGGRAGSRE